MNRFLAKATPTTRVFVYSTMMALAAGVFGFDTGTRQFPHTAPTRSRPSLPHLRLLTSIWFAVGAITQMPEFEMQFGVLEPFLRGIVVAIILVPSALVSLRLMTSLELPAPEPRTCP